ncbi:MAG: TetR/AcrR family transcriptional regulator [Leptospirales bacterium]|nr:TetR/AcrR family transcriptional regulator [Leptospirales bacterium]
MLEAQNEDLQQIADARSQSNPGARLLQAARQLFHEQGYAAAGINEIIARAGASKKSFYAYYPAKRDLGAAFLQSEEQSLLQLLSALRRKHPEDAAAFLRSWAGHIKKRAAAGKFYGCPLALLSAQAADDFSQLLPQSLERWRRWLESYLRQCSLPNAQKARAAVLSRLILMQYQGAAQMWRLSKDHNYFDLFASASVAALRGQTSAGSGTRRLPTVEA